MSLHDDARLTDNANALREQPFVLLEPRLDRLTQFPYFDELLGHPSGKGARSSISGERRHVSRERGRQGGPRRLLVHRHQSARVEQGRLTYPRAHFVHFNRYSPQYNPTAFAIAIPDCGVKFDIILAFSVFTHVDQEEMVESWTRLRRMLAPDGVLAFTFFDPQFDRSLSDPACRGIDSAANLGPRGSSKW
jgi:hypothetical protein